MSAIPFVRRTANERVDGTLTVKIDIDPMYKLQFLQMFPEIGAAGALAALAQGVNIEPEVEKQKPGSLCIVACTFCKDPLFWKWVSQSQYECRTENHAKEWIYGVCDVKTRLDLDTNKIAMTRFLTLIREPFMAWRANK